jgi:hypothetical protein
VSMGWARSTQRVLVSAIAAGIAVQFFLAGAGAFHAAGYGAHRALGWALLIAAGIAFVVALAAVRLVGHSAFLLLVFGLQAGLGVLGADTQAWFGALHAVNALAVMGAAGTLARRAWAAV